MFTQIRPRRFFLVAILGGDVLTKVAFDFDLERNSQRVVGGVDFTR